jgi:hypothetical protein
MADIPVVPRGTNRQGMAANAAKNASGRASSIVSNTSGGSVNDEFSDDEDDDDDDDDENLEGENNFNLFNYLRIEFPRNLPINLAPYIC